MMTQYAIFSDGQFLGAYESVSPVYALAKLDSKRLTMHCLATFTPGKTVLTYDDGKEYTICFK